MSRSGRYALRILRWPGQQSFVAAHPRRFSSRQNYSAKIWRAPHKVKIPRCGPLKQSADSIISKVTTAPEESQPQTVLFRIPYFDIEGEEGQPRCVGEWQSFRQ